MAGVDTSEIRQWRSIVTLIAFVIANILVLWPFHIPVYVPKPLVDVTWRCFVHLRIIPATTHHAILHNKERCTKHFVRFNFPVNFITAPLIADLFLLAISAIGRQEVHDGTVGANHIHPLDIMAFFITLAYIAISIDASGIIRWLAFKVLSWGGKVGHRLFFYLYAFFFLLGSFIGNDPIILSGTAFLAYMTRVSKNITSPRAWIFTQFSVANIASAILVSSNPTNLVLAGAFDIKFIVYTANMIVPVVVTAIVLFPFLLYVVFADEKLIPSEIEMHTLPQAAKEKEPVNPNIPYVQHQAEESAESGEGRQEMTLSLAYIMNPFLDRKGAAFGALIMSATLITVLAINAASTGTGEIPVFWVTVPAAFVMFCWDLGSGWIHRHDTRETAAKYKAEMVTARAERALQRSAISQDESEPKLDATFGVSDGGAAANGEQTEGIALKNLPDTNDHTNSQFEIPKLVVSNTAGNSPVIISGSEPQTPAQKFNTPPGGEDTLHAQNMSTLPSAQMDAEKLEAGNSQQTSKQPIDKPNLVSKSREAYEWLQETFPTVMAVAAHLPFALVPFAFAMFVLVQALVSTGWVNVFAWGWYHWSKRTGTIGSIGGMAFLSVVLSNFSGTNIGTTILLSRIIQAWKEINCTVDTSLITDRTYWATIYSMALGVNYGAFSTAFSASLAGLLWRDILARKHIHVKSHEFARVNFPIIAISMAVGCLVLVGEVYIVRDNSPYASWEKACPNR
ncbi:hypothetical protein FVEN_g2110 [Fusarium venenatum]|uniref:Citrate transporter-like domain-containing protein n=1 Tax=Fusarium venenatum TaxID=56646 RepID=A0A2L2SRM7_9HYPO|nr:uncharacterized protein FVRRES_12521 [Fusarium venenatum]KAG8360373.1 hypothetical protein FVEN_g2110 [Fusarium venenatum]KAH6979134.1 hypothetical protein EDB82DRAFT_507129 [Fusarium venenatum]CEI39830.1 unnamed protein product [Fusarium venenatum]